MSDGRAALPEDAAGQFRILLAGIAKQHATAGRQQHFDTLALCGRIAARWPSPLSNEDREALGQLARKLAVAKRVDRSYLPEWKRDGAAQELPPADYLSLMIVLLAFASAGEADAAYDRGFNLQLLNGALLARDHCGAAAELATAVEAATQAIIGKNFHA